MGKKKKKNFINSYRYNFWWKIYQEYILTGKGDQITAARFILDNEGNVLEINRREKDLLKKTRQSKGWLIL